MENGWIKLHRSILRWEWWDDRNVRDLFLYCLLAANHEETRWHGEVVPRGSFVTSLSKLAKGAGLTVKETRRAIEKLEGTNELGTQRTNQYSVITINKYEKYQLRKEDEGHAEGTQRASEGHTDGQAKGNKQEIEEYNNIINNISLTHRACDIYKKGKSENGEGENGEMVNENGSEVKRIEELGQEYENEIRMQGENFGALHRLTKKSAEELVEYLARFNDTLIVAQTYQKTRSDYRRHFLSWLKIQIEMERKQACSGSRQPYNKENEAVKRLHNVGDFNFEGVRSDF